MQTYTIEGMTRGHCVRGIEKALASVPRVSHVRGVDLARGEAQLEGSPDEELVVAAIRETGYAAKRAS